jgi:hypothetical protein
MARLTKIFAMTALATSMAATTSGQVPSPAPVTSAASERPVPFVRVLKKTVVSIETDCKGKDKSGKMKQDPHSGTGFLLDYSDPAYKDIVFHYLVTNRHVVSPGIEANNPCQVISSSLRVNRKVADVDGSFAENIPVAKVVPSQQLLDLLASQGLVLERNISANLNKTRLKSLVPPLRYQ